MTASLAPGDSGAPPAESVAAAKRAERKKRRRHQLAGQALLAPATLWLTIFLVVPLVLILLYAIAGERDFVLFETTVESPTAEHFQTALSGSFLTAFLRALWFAFLTALFALLLGYPLAYFISRHGGKHKVVYLFLVMIPFWTSYLARMFAWRSLFSNAGAINTVLGGLGIIDSAHPPQWLGSPVAVLIVLVYTFLPFMILPLYISIDRLDYRLVEASYDLGAGRVSTFLRVTLRQTLPGVLGGSLIVFIPAVGDFATPQIIGLNTVQTKMIGQQIQELFNKSNYPLGSALSMLLMAIIIVCMLLYIRVVGRRGEAGF